MPVYFIIGMTYGFAAAVMPGPFLTYLISQTLNNGWRRTFPAVFSPLLSDIPVAVLVLLVLSHVPAWLIQILQFAGGFFILYLALGAMKTWRNYDIKKTAPIQSIRQSVLKATMVNILNPGPFLGWSLVIGPLLLKGWREAPLNGITLLASFYGAMIISLMGIIMLFAAARNIGPKVNRAMVGISALALACFGFYRLWLGIMTYW